MNKTLEALLRGYVRFEVNDERFWSYNAAVARRRELCQDESLNVYFKGLSVWRGKWLYFFIRQTHTSPDGWGGGILATGEYLMARRGSSFTMTAEK